MLYVRTLWEGNALIRCKGLKTDSAGGQRVELKFCRAGFSIQGVES